MLQSARGKRAVSMSERAKMKAGCELTFTLNELASSKTVLGPPSASTSPSLPPAGSSDSSGTMLAASRVLLSACWAAAIDASGIVTDGGAPSVGASSVDSTVVDGASTSAEGSAAGGVVGAGAVDIVEQKRRDRGCDRAWW